MRTDAQLVAEHWAGDVADAVAAIRALDGLLAQVGDVARAACAALESGAKILTCGNGGSALEAQHFAAELIAHFKRDRRSLPAVSLPLDYGVLTAIGNDIGFDDIFARQVEGLARPGDVVIGFSTSGRSHNVARALNLADQSGCDTVAFTGRGGGPVADAARHVLRAPTDSAARVQECHLFLTHAVCEYIDAYFAD